MHGGKDTVNYYVQMGHSLSMITNLRPLIAYTSKLVIMRTIKSTQNISWRKTT